MKKTFSSFALFALIISVAGVAQAQVTATTSLQVGITTADLGVQNPGILPNNPLYFFKEFGRNIQKFFTFDPITRAGLELKITNEKAAELKKVEEVSPKDAAALENAVKNYNNSVTSLKSRIEMIKEKSDNPAVDQLLSNITDRAIKHTQLLDELIAAHSELKDQASSAETNFNKTISQIPQKFEDEKKFGERLKAILGEQKDISSRELNSFSFLNKLEEHASTSTFEELIGLRSDLTKQFENRFTKENLSAEDLVKLLDKMSVSTSTRLQILGDIKDTTSHSDIKKELKALFESDIKDLEDSEAITSEKAKEQINNAIELAQELEARLAQVQNDKAQSFLDKARANISEAKKLYDEASYGAAYGSATSAASLAKNGLRLVIQLERKVNIELKTPEKNEQKKSSKTKSGIFCTMEYDPVCGDDGKIYSNSCFARVAGASVVSKGPACGMGVPIKKEKNKETVPTIEGGNR